MKQSMNTIIHTIEQLSGNQLKLKRFIIKILNWKSAIIRTSTYKYCFAKGYTLNWSEEVFAIKKVKNTVPWAYVINDLKGKEIIERFCEKELQKTSQQEFRIEKVIKRIGDKLYVKWKGYDKVHLIAG